jgi:hypothetical protein
MPCEPYQVTYYEGLCIKNTPKIFALKVYYNNISLSWAPPFPTRPPLLPLSPQNMLDHVSAFIRP